MASLKKAASRLARAKDTSVDSQKTRSPTKLKGTATKEKVKRRLKPSG